MVSQQKTAVGGASAWGSRGPELIMIVIVVDSSMAIINKWIHTPEEKTQL